MDADDILWAELTRSGVNDIRELESRAVVELAIRYGVWLPIAAYAQSPWLAPFAIRKIRIRTDPNAPGQPRDLWGFPDGSGRFTDDNSLIKATIRGKQTIGANSPYQAGRLSTGMVCCHVWPKTTGDPLLFSFVPNLVWLPRSLAGMSDGHFTNKEPHELHFALRTISLLRFGPHKPNVGGTRVAMAWSRLATERPDLNSRTSMQVTELSGGDQIAKTAHTRNLRVVRFLDELNAGGLPSRRVSKRYHAGVGARIDLSPAIQSFVSSTELRRLAEDLRVSQQPS